MISQSFCSNIANVVFVMSVVQQLLVNASPYCRPGTPLPNITDLYQPCGSCQDRCGQVNLKTNHNCACDTNCLAYGDCCPDFQTLCHMEFQQGEPLLRHFQYRGTVCLEISKALRCSQGLSSFISVCGLTGETCNSTSIQNLDEPNLAIPVSDLDTGISYINFWCAKCNGVTRLTYLEPYLLCLGNNFDTISDSGTLRKVLQEPGCSVELSVKNKREFKLRPFCHELKHLCSGSCQNDVLKAKCENGFIRDYVIGKEVYDNPYCALCAGETLEGLHCNSVTFPCFGPRPPPDIPVFSISILFDFNPRHGLVVGQRPCPQYHERDRETGECHQTSCPEGRRFIAGVCHPLVLTIDFLSISLSFNNIEDAQDVTTWLKKIELATRAEEGIKFNLNQSMYSIYQSEMMIKVIENTEITTNNSVNISYTLEVSFDANSNVTFGEDLHGILNISHVMEEHILLALTEAGFDLSLVEISIMDHIIFSNLPLNGCTWSSYDKNDYTLTNGILTIKGVSHTYTESEYQLTRGKVIVCVRASDMTVVDLNVSETLAILTVVLICLSIICLFLRILLQFLMPSNISFASRLQANLCFALMLAFIMVLVTGVVGQYNNLSGGLKGQSNALVAGVKNQQYLPLACALSGVLMYWFFVAAFLWMLAISFDIWLKFQPSRQLLKQDDTNKSVAIYAAPCWVISALLTGGVVGLDFADIDPRFKPQFGTRLCWFNQRYALLAYFGSVLALSMALISTFLVISVLNLRRILNADIRSTARQHSVWVYVRIAVLMGVTWAFGFVAAFIGHEALWIVFILLNASQGILIFISFVLRRAVCKQCCCTKESKSENESQQTRQHSSSSPVEDSRSKP